MPSGAAALDATLTAAGLSGEVVDIPNLGPVVRVQMTHVVAALEALRDADDTAFAMLVDLMGVDTGEEIELTYHLRSFLHESEAYVRIAVPYDGEIHSVWRCYPAALYPEREAAELFGLTFVGHPNPKRLLTTDEVEVPLLRKSVQIRSVEEARR